VAIEAGWWGWIEEKTMRIGTKMAPAPGGEGHGDFDAGTFGILIAAAEAEPALG